MSSDLLGLNLNHRGGIPAIRDQLERGQFLLHVCCISDGILFGSLSGTRKVNVF